MATAIHFPEPVTTDHPAVLPMLEQPPTGWKKYRRVVIIASIVVAVGGLILGLVQSVPTARPTVDPGGVAELLVRDHVSRSQDRYVVNSTVVASSERDGITVITVATEVLALTEGGYVSDAMHYFELGLVASTASWEPVSAPSEVAAPLDFGADFAPLGPPTEGPATAAVHGYLAWLLTGADGAYEGRRPNQAPYVDVRITGLEITESGKEAATAQVQAQAVDRFGHPIDLAYTLDLVNQHGLWAIVTDG